MRDTEQLIAKALDAPADRRPPPVSDFRRSTPTRKFRPLPGKAKPMLNHAPVTREQALDAVAAPVAVPVVKAAPPVEPEGITRKSAEELELNLLRRLIDRPITVTINEAPGLEIPAD